MRKIAIIGVHELNPVAVRRQIGGGELERRRIAIEADNPLRPAIEQGTAVASESDGAVDKDTAARRLEERQCFRDKDRSVEGVRHQIPNSANARASSSP